MCDESVQFQKKIRFIFPENYEHNLAISRSYFAEYRTLIDKDFTCKSRAYSHFLLIKPFVW